MYVQYLIGTHVHVHVPTYEIRSDYVTVNMQVIVIKYNKAYG